MSEADIAGARRSWRLAEARLYPLAMTNVDGYQRALLLVAGVRELLRERASSAADLVVLQADATVLVADAADTTSTSAAGLDTDDVFGAAAAALDRELAGQEHRRAVLAGLEAARDESAAWADVHRESLGPLVPELRVHVASGRAVLTARGVDEETGAPVLQVTTVRIDLATGDVGEDPSADVLAVASADGWAEVVTALQASIVCLP